MQTCSNCGASVRNEARFCTSCGTRLNPPTESDATAAWPAASPTPAPTPDPSVWDKVRESIRTGEAAKPDIVPQEDVDTDNPAESSPENGDEERDAFSWSWGVPSQSADDSATTDDGDDANAGVEATVTGGKDATATSSEDTDSAEDREESQETLAAWASSWNATDDTGDASEAVDAADVKAAVAQLTDAVEDAESKPTTEAEEDTIARAERLIGELQALIPTLAKPKPAPPAARLRPKLLRSSLESARGGSDYAELRSLLHAANDNPRDIEQMMSLSGRVGEILSLLDDRDQLAKAVDDVTAQLREAEDDDEESDSQA